MPMHGGVFVVIEPRSAQQLVVHRKTQRLDEMQLAAGVGGQADHVAGVGRDFGVDENDAKHLRSEVRAAGGLRRRSVGQARAVVREITQ